MTQRIISLQNQRVKNAIKLRDRRGRQKQDRIIIDGVREIMRAMEAGVIVSELYYSAKVQQTDGLHEVLEQAETAGAELLETTPSVFAKLAFGKRDEGIVAVAQTPRQELADLQLPESPLVAVLEGVEKPGNVGAILRSADAAGVNAVIVTDGGTDLYNPNAIRASLGAIFTLPVCSIDGPTAIAWLKEGGFQILAARVDAKIDYCGTDYRPATAIVLGSENAGLSDAWRDVDVKEIKLPMCGTVDSLNVSATAAVLFYEALRQRCCN